MKTVNKMIEDMGDAFEQFVDANNARLTNMEKEFGIERNRNDELELQIARDGTGGRATHDQQYQSARVFAQMRTPGRANDELDVDMDEYRAYKSAFAAYLRRGEPGLSGDIRNALSVGSDPDGGYFVEPDTGGKIAQLVHETSPIRKIASVAKISSVDALEGINDLDEAAFGWVGETEARTDTATPQVGAWRVPLHELFGQPKSSQKILDDSNFDVEGWLTGKLGRRFARAESTAFVNGDGVKKPRGFLTYPHGVPSKATWDVIERFPTGVIGAFAASNPADILFDVLFSLKADYLDGAVWVMARSTLRDVMKLKDGQGNYLVSGGDATSATPKQLLGHDVIFAEDMPAIAVDSLAIAFGNFTQAYQIVDHVRGMRLLRDPFTEKGFVKFYSYRRVGGDVVNFEAIKLVRFAVAAT